MTLKSIENVLLSFPNNQHYKFPQPSLQSDFVFSRAISRSNKDNFHYTSIKTIEVCKLKQNITKRIEELKNIETMKSIIPL